MSIRKKHIQNKMKFLNQLKTFSGTFLICLVTGITQPTFAAFDPVNDDTDIFLANPNNDAGRPNVLIFLDNTANWNTAFDNEKSALVSVVNGLSDQYNVGLMFFPETGNPNDNVDGAYIRYGVRQMTTANKAVLASGVSNLDRTADAGNNNTLSEGMAEAYRYFSGKASIASFGKEKTDFDGNNNTTNNPAFLSPFQEGLTDGFALGATPTASSLYNSPVSDACQDSFIIYISNGGANENNSSLTKAETELAAAGYDTNNIIALNPASNQQEGSWMDEWAKYLANADINGSDVGTPHVYTYVVEIDPVATGQGDDMTTLMKSVATNGKGDYFSVSSSGSETAIVNALNSIFQEIQAVNSVFAAATLPVSVNVRGTNLNQVYLGVFRPDATKSPRWFGNLKAYKLAIDSNGIIFLADSQEDVNGDPVSAQNLLDGFIESTAVSHWSASSSYWGFRDATENGTGGTSDSPDGELVEKGGSAQRARTAFATSQAARNLYTCTTGGTVPTDDCDATGDLLSATPFATSNDDLTAAVLGLGTTIVENLTAFVSQTVESITDSQDVSALTTVTAMPVLIDTFSSAAISADINSIITGGAQDIDAIDNDPTTNNITAASRSNAGNKLPITITTALAHGLNSGDPVTISGFNGDTEYNGSFTVTGTVTSNTFQYNNTGNNTPGNNPNVSSAQIGGTSSVVTVVINDGHGFSGGETVTIAATTPTDFNGPTNTPIVLDATNPTTTFTFTTIGALSPIDTAGGIGTAGTVTGDSTIATVTTDAAHAIVNVGDITISGATENTYNGTFPILSSTPGTSTFTFDVGVVGVAAEGAGAKVAQNQTSQIVTAFSVNDADFVVAPPLAIGSIITITGADAGYNGTHTLTAIDFTASPDEFTFVPSDPLPAPTQGGSFSAGANSTTATATVTGHGFSGGETVTISGATPTDYNDEFTITFIDADTFTYDLELVDGIAANGLPAPDPATGSISVRLGASTDDITAIVMQTAHGYSEGDVITIAGADPDVYNGEVTILTGTSFSTDTFAYTVTGEKNAQGTASGSITSNVKTTTATATVPNHGLGDGSGADCGSNVVSGVSISGASESAFNGTFEVYVQSSDTFLYPIPASLGTCTHDVNGDSPVTTTDDVTYASGVLSSAEGDATGSNILASFGSVSGSAITDLIAWVRGTDNEDDENADTSFTDVRSTLHGDVLHSRPAVVNYNRHGNDEDVYIFYGSNDGVFRAAKGGLEDDPSDGVSGTEPIPGMEAWGFIPKEHFADLARLRNNSPIISSSFKKPYFVDGSLGTYVLDADDDGILGETGDKVWIFTSNHRGGRFIYALDVTDPLAPEYLWSKSNTDTGWGELGQTWSVPQVRTIAANSGNPVLIFGAGYDADVEDLDPGTITAVNTTTGAVTSNSFTYTRSMGRGIFVVDAETGAIVVQIGPAGSDPGTTDPYITVTDMVYAIPSDIAILTDRNGSTDNRMYFGDTGGNLWRVDMDDADVTNWEVTKIANIADTTTTAVNSDGDTVLPGLRKFLFPPDVVRGDGDEQNEGDDFDAILIGSGDREHPFDSNVENRFYMFKDLGVDPLASGDTPVTSNLSESSLFDATSNCVQDEDACSGSGLEADSAAAADAFETTEGWLIKLNAGEKVVGNAVTLNNVTFFNTNEPTTASSTSCESDLGTARQYQVNFGDATASEDKDYIDGITAADRSVTSPGGGYLPSPVPVVVELNDGKIHDVVMIGTDPYVPPESKLGARLRKFWFKEIED